MKKLMLLVLLCATFDAAAKDKKEITFVEKCQIYTELTMDEVKNWNNLYFILYPVDYVLESVLFGIPKGVACKSCHKVKEKLNHSLFTQSKNGTICQISQPVEAHVINKLHTCTQLYPDLFNNDEGRISLENAIELKRSAATIKVLIQGGADKAYDKDGISVMRKHASNPLIFKQLVDAGADIDISDDCNGSLIDWAIYNRNIEATEILIHNDVNLQAKGICDRLPIQAALQSYLDTKYDTTWDKAKNATSSYKILTLIAAQSQDIILTQAEKDMAAQDEKLMAIPALKNAITDKNQ